MHLPEEALQAFIHIYEEVYGVALGRDEARTRAHNLLALYCAVLLPPDGQSRMPPVECADSRQEEGSAGTPPHNL